MSYVYYPGCQYTDLSPEVSVRMQNYLEQRFHMKITGCCRKNSHLLTEQDTAFCVCPTCLTNLRTRAPRATVLSLWELLADDDRFPWPDYQARAITVQDCMDTCNQPGLQHAVRKILSRMNVTAIEIEQSFSRADFCRPRTEEQIRRTMKHCKNYPTDSAVCYCTGCLKGINLSGKQGIHLIDLIMGRNITESQNQITIA